MQHLVFVDDVLEFDEADAPNWLRRGGLKGSTMCNRWFWHEHIKTLNVGEYKETDFHKITRLV